MWRRLARRLDRQVQQLPEDDSQERLEQALQSNRESVEQLHEVTRRGVTVRRHAQQERNFRRENGFVATILDSLQVKP